MRPYVDPYRLTDRAALYDICLRTGDLGGDAGRDYADPDLLGHVFVGPYLELEPELAFVLRDGRRPVGYVVATADTVAFEDACELRWWPPLREHYRAHPPRPGSADAARVAAVETGIRTRGPWLAQYPAHLHINLLPEARGGGHGRALIARLTEELARRGVPGVHLGVARENTGAVAFYERLGLTPVDAHSATLVMARRLEERP